MGLQVSKKPKSQRNSSGRRWKSQEKKEDRGMNQERGNNKMKQSLLRWCQWRVGSGKESLHDHVAHGNPHHRDWNSRRTEGECQSGLEEGWIMTRGKSPPRTKEFLAQWREHREKGLGLWSPRGKAGNKDVPKENWPSGWSCSAANE